MINNGKKHLVFIFIAIFISNSSPVLAAGTYDCPSTYSLDGIVYNLKPDNSGKLLFYDGGRQVNNWGESGFSCEYVLIKEEIATCDELARKFGCKDGEKITQRLGEIKLSVFWVKPDNIEPYKKESEKYSGMSVFCSEKLELESSRFANKYYPDRYILVRADFRSAFNFNNPDYFSSQKFQDFADVLAGQVREEALSCPESLSLVYFPTFDHLKPGTFEKGPAGDIVATLKDEDGKGIKGETVVFYVDKETPQSAEPGKNLYETLRVKQLIQNKPPVKILDEPVERKYLGWTYTDSDGRAKINMIDSHLIDSMAFARELITQKATFEERGKISGIIRAGVYNQKTQRLEKVTTVPVEYSYLAKILKIYGEGRPDDAEEWKKYPGKVRVKREGVFPKFNFTPVEDNFPLMPGDILEIDGNAAVEIAWATGDQAIAKVPDEIQFKQTSVRSIVGTIIIAPGAIESGFPRTMKRVTVGIGKAVKWTLKQVPFFDNLMDVDEAGQDIIEVFGSDVKDHSNYEVMAKIRIRSLVTIDNTGENVKFYTLEGSPDVITDKGGEVTLEAGKMVDVSTDGTISNVQDFDVETVEEEFYSSSPVIERIVLPDEKNSPGIGLAIGVIIILISYIGHKKHRTKH